MTAAALDLLAGMWSAAAACGPALAGVGGLVAIGAVALVVGAVTAYCDRYCQPSAWEPVAGTACDEVRAACVADDGTGAPNCAWVTRSCD